jgi:hypothetical protein
MYIYILFYCKPPIKHLRGHTETTDDENTDAIE